MEYTLVEIQRDGTRIYQGEEDGYGYSEDVFGSRNYWACPYIPIFRTDTPLRTGQCPD